MIAQPIAIDLPARKTKVTRPVIRVGKEEFEILAEGKLAEEFANLLAGTPIGVFGSLLVHRWKSANGDKHQRLEIVAKRVIP